MRCPHCQYENLPDSVFCPECGTRLERSCSHCGTDNRLTSRFCRKCGEPLTAQSHPPVSSFKFQVSGSQSPGDGIFAFFGAPIAHEDHPHRALYAALLMQEESRRFAEKLRREQGINWFTEGFDTPDLKDAKALLEELEEKATIASGRKSKKRTGRNEETGKRRKGKVKPK